MAIRGSLDVITTLGATGWAYSAAEKILTVQALLNHQVIGEAEANMYRADLATVGFGDGNCGYDIRFFQELDPLYLPFVVVKPDGGDVELPRASISGLSEFFRTLYTRYPVTGRHRSVFGGLWTDRMDLAAVLKGRVSVGMVDAETAAVLARFIQTGIVVVNDVLDASLSPVHESGNSGTDDTGGFPQPANRIQSLLQAAPLVRLLRALLEDHPLVLRVSPIEAAGRFQQPSTIEGLPSPGECVALVAPCGGGINVDVIRDSHLLPEFNSDGVSRWIDRSGSPLESACKQWGVVDRYFVQQDSVVVVGPGTLHRVVLDADSSALRALCTPAHQAPVKFAPAELRRELVLKSGVTIWEQLSE